MEIRTQRQHGRARHHRGDLRRIVTVSTTGALAVAVAVGLAACTRTDTTSASTTTVSRSATRTITRALPTKPVRAVLRVVPPTTTTTTRPAVNPDTGPPPANTGVGRRIVYCNSCQKVWLIDDTDFVEAMFSVSGRRGTPSPGTYQVFRKLEMGRSKAHPELRLPYFVGFAWGSTTDIGFHGIPLRPDGSAIQSDAQLGQPLSAGCVRESQLMAKVLYDWTPEGTTVVVTA